MNTKFKVALAVVAGAALGAVATHGLHAQAKPKAYTISEIETLDVAAQKAYVPLVLAAIKAAGGHTYNTAGGRIAPIVGTAPKRVAINEWDSLEQAQAFYNSKVWKDLAPQRDKAQKLIRVFAVEALAN
jgi:uncharacterized protein (DUF1330 family)